MYYMSNTVLCRKGSGHSIRKNNHDLCLSSLSYTLLSVKHYFIIMIGVKPNRVSEAKKATWSGSVLEFGIISV